MSETKLDIAFLREEIERHDLRWFDKTYTIVGKDEARALLAAAEERDALRSELASLKAPVDRPNFSAIAEKVCDDANTLPTRGLIQEIDAALRTAYQRGWREAPENDRAQTERLFAKVKDQGAEIERLRADYERQLADMTTTLEQANAIYDAAKAEIERLRGALRDAERSHEPCAGEDCWCVEARAALSPAPASSASPVDSLTGEAQRVCSHYFRRGERYCSDCGAADPDYEAPALSIAQKQPVEAEQPKRECSKSDPNNCYTSGPCAIHYTKPLGGDPLPPDHSLEAHRSGTSQEECDACMKEQPKPRVSVTVETCPLCAGRKGEPGERLCDGHRENCPRCLGWRGAHAVLCDTKMPPAAPMKEQPKPAAEVRCDEPGCEHGTIYLLKKEWRGQDQGGETCPKCLGTGKRRGEEGR